MSNNLEDLFKKLLKSGQAEIVNIKDLEKKLGNKAKIAHLICNQLGDSVRDGVMQHHMATNSELKKDFTMVMAILCGLMDDGKIILKKKIEKGDENGNKPHN